MSIGHSTETWSPCRQTRLSTAYSPAANSPSTARPLTSSRVLAAQPGILR